MITRRAFIASVAAASIAPAASAQEPKRLLRAADVHPNGYPTVEAVKWIGEKLARETDGRLGIHVYHSGQLGREPDTVDLARLGALDITRVNFAALNNAFPLTQIFSLPYVFANDAHIHRATDGKVGDAVLAAFAQRGLVGLAIYDAGPRCFYNVHRPVYEPKDLNGLKMRVPGSDIFIEFAKALGANPTPLPVSDCYSALQTHLIDGAENNWQTFQSSRQFEVAHYWSESDHSYSPEALLMSRRTFDALAPADRELLVATARESVGYMRGLWNRMQLESKKLVLAAGVKSNEIDRRAFERAVAPVLEKYLNDRDLAPLHAMVRALN